MDKGKRRQSRGPHENAGSPGDGGAFTAPA